MATKLVGRDSTSDRLQEVTLGAGLTMTGSTLSADPAPPVAMGYDVGFCFIGTPAASTVMCYAMVSTPFRLPAGLADSQAFCVVAPSAGTVVMDIENGSLNTIGQVTFTAGSNTGVFIWATDQDFAVADNLAVRTPADVKGISDIAFTFKGVKL